MPILLVDPNEILTNQGSDPRFKSFIPEYEEMTPYVEFYAIRKSEIVQYLNSSKDTLTNDSNFTKVNLIGFDDSDPTNLQYTARWTNDINNGSNRDSTEGFGIKSIHIKNNASQTPIVNVTFIDVKGTSLFSKGETSKYGVLLDFPPPLFVLRIKGVYGLLTEYRLNLLRTSTEFKGENGNFEIQADFIGYNIAPLTDISIGYLMAVHEISREIDSSININQSTYPRSVFELVMKGDILYNRLDNYKNNSKDLVKINEIKDDLDKIDNNVFGFIDFLKKKENLLNYYNSPTSNNLTLVEVMDNKSDYTIDISFDFTQIDNDEKVRLSKIIKDYYTSTINNFISNNNYLPISKSDIKFVEFGESNTGIDSLNIFKTSEINSPYVTLDQNDDNIKQFQIQYKPFETKVKTKYDDLLKKRKVLSEKIRNEIGDVSQIDIFKPTIKNITDIVTTDIGRLFNEILEASQKTPHIKDDFIKSSSPFPEVWERKTIGNRGDNKYYKIYPGSKKEFKDWGEVELVEKIITALSRQQSIIKKLDELQSIENGDSKWIPINPIETEYGNVSENEYFTNKLNSNKIYETITKRYISARDYTYKGLIENDDILAFVAKCEAKNLAYAINTENTLLDSFKNIADNYGKNNDLKSIINLLPSDSVYRDKNYSFESINVNNVTLYNKLTKPNEFNALRIVDSSDVKSATSTENQNNIVQLIEGIKETSLNWVQKYFTNKNIEMSNKNVLVFLDNKKNTESNTIDDDYDETIYNSDFFYSVGGLTRIVDDYYNYTKPSVNKTLSFNDFFTYINKNQYFLDPTNDIRVEANNYKIYFSSLVEYPIIYLLYMGFLIKNSKSPNLLGAYNFIESLSVNDSSLILEYYNNFISDFGDEFINNTDNFFNDKYNSAITEEDKKSLINNVIINNDDFNLMGKIYLSNNSTIGLGHLNKSNNTINVPTPYVFSKNEKVYSDLNFKSLDPDNLIDQKYFKYLFLELSNSITEIKKQNESQNKSGVNGFDDNDIKLQVYYDLKKLYDTWLSIPSNQSGSKNLYDDLFGTNLGNSFKFVDRAMSTVAADAILDYRNFVEDSKNFDLSIYTILTKLYSYNNFLFFPLQSSMVFSTYDNIKDWESCFKLNTQNINDNKSKPAFVCMYIDAFSSNLNNGSQDFPDDGISFLPNSELGDTNSSSEDFTNSVNNVFVLKVEIGKQNQSYFSNLKMNTNEHTNTHEALKLADLMSRKNADTNPLSKGQSLFEVFNQRSYSCNVEVPLGNLCIQPIMYFELVGAPIFYGGYIITHVEHYMDGDSNKLKTSFKGTRIGRVGVPFVTDGVVKFIDSLNIDQDTRDLLNNNEINPFEYDIFNSTNELKI